MREKCSCGASIRARRRDVLAWRTEHRHEAQTPAVGEPEPQGAQSQVEAAWTPGYTDDSERCIPDIRATATIGFTRNGYSIRSIELSRQLRATALKNLGSDE